MLYLKEGVLINYCWEKSCSKLLVMYISAKELHQLFPFFILILNKSEINQEIQMHMLFIKSTEL